LKILNQDVPLETAFDDGYQWRARDYYKLTNKYSRNKFNFDNDYPDHDSIPRSLPREESDGTFSGFSISSINIAKILKQNSQKRFIPISRFGGDSLIYSLDLDQIALKSDDNFEKTLINLAKEMRRYGY
jgi:hypothetical protein